MEKVKKWAMGEFWNGYSLFEKCFMAGLVLLQVIIFAMYPDSPLNIICGISGVISVVLCAKGKISFYYIGFIQTVSYLVLSWNQRFYGEVIENVFYLVTMFIGIFLWKRHMIKNDDGSKSVAAKKFTPLQWLGSIIITGIATYIMGLWLTSIGSSLPYADAATNIIAIFAQLMMIKRFREQWIWWIVLNLICIGMWIVAKNWSLVAMYIAWTVNSIYGWVNWSKLNKQAEALAIA